MCNRYQPTRKALELVSLGVPDWPAPHKPVVWPQDEAPVAVRSGESLSVDWMRWGFLREHLPGPVFNTRSDSLGKAIWSEALARRRCLVPAAAFIEGNKRDGVFTATRADGTPLYMAGLWEPADGCRRYSVITTDPNAEVARIHDRMPAVLEPEDIPAWLAPDAAPDRLRVLLAPMADGSLWIERQGQQALFGP